jgi:hypothetical protein
VNSEELELSLRTEFESYLKGVLARMQQDVADFQKNFEGEFEKHKAQMDEAFRGLSARFESDLMFDRPFTESVIEHLRLARDDGAQLTANAFNEAQKLDQPSAPADYDQLRDAINDISSQTTQSAILKSLVDNAASFTSRGAFFIVKHDNFVCWRRFDADGSSDDESVREVHFPVAADTLLADSIESLSTTSNSTASHTEDSVYVDALGFGRPDRMFAIPLVARGRGVAVLYADNGNGDEAVNLEAIESLVRVAGLTVELRAASAAAAQPATAEVPTYVPMQSDESSASVETESTEPDDSTSEEYSTVDTADYEEYTGEVAVEDSEAEDAEEQQAELETAEADEAAHFEPVPIEQESIVAEPEYTEVAEPEYAEVEVSETVAEEPVNDFAFAPSETYDASAEAEQEESEEYAYTAETKNGRNGHAYEAAPEPVVELSAAQPTKSRFSDRNVDLPIEVSDEERRLHNDARRFARLLVSEIKLYNEQKVHEGRDVGDLYDRLREAIDRSREMYDKRVQPQVAAKFDYFHYELVSNLAEGNDAKLGASYPGASV